MADCLTYWSTAYNGDYFNTSWNMCSDDEENKALSLLDDLAEAKRHIDTDDINNDADVDCISLWDEQWDEQWTTKDCASGPTLAELNGGKLNDLEQYESLQVTTKRKRARSSMAGNSDECARKLTVPVICDVNETASHLHTVKLTNVVADGSVNLDAGLQQDCEQSVSLGEQHDMKGMLFSVKSNRKLYQIQKSVRNVQSETVSSPRQLKGDMQKISSASTSHSEHVFPCNSKLLQQRDALESADDVSPSKKMKTNHQGLSSSFKLCVNQRIMMVGGTNAFTTNLFLIMKQ